MNSPAPMEIELSPTLGMKRALSSEINTPRVQKKQRLITASGMKSESDKSVIAEALKKGYALVPLKKASASDGDSSTDSEGTKAERQVQYNSNLILARSSFTTNTGSLLDDNADNANSDDDSYDDGSE